MSTEKINDTDFLDKPRKQEKPYNKNKSEQIKLFTRLLQRAKLEKIDCIGLCWIDSDYGQSGYLDWNDIPSKSLKEILKQTYELMEKAESETS